MGLPINQRVIIFTANYTDNPVEDIHDYTTLESIGIIGQEDTITYTMELEESFGIPYEEGDAKGILTVGDATILIENKLHAVSV